MKCLVWGLEHMGPSKRLVEGNSNKKGSASSARISLSKELLEHYLWVRVEATVYLALASDCLSVCRDKPNMHETVTEMTVHK